MYSIFGPPQKCGLQHFLAPKQVGCKEITIVQPPPSSHCELCGGELRLNQVESANRALDLESEILVCVKCGHEQAYIVSHNHTVCHMSDPKAA